MKVIIYTDGGADPNPGIGGWAAILRAGDHEKVLTGSDPETSEAQNIFLDAIKGMKLSLQLNNQLKEIRNV